MWPEILLRGEPARGLDVAELSLWSSVSQSVYHLLGEFPFSSIPFSQFKSPYPYNCLFILVQRTQDQILPSLR